MNPRLQIRLLRLAVPIEHVPRCAYPANPPTNDERMASWWSVYRHFANEYAAEAMATACDVEPEYEH